MSARLIEVIEVVVTKGEGISEDPVRQVVQYWTKDGVFLADNDKYEWTNREQPSSQQGG